MKKAVAAVLCAMLTGGALGESGCSVTTELISANTSQDQVNEGNMINRKGERLYQQARNKK